MNKLSIALWVVRNVPGSRFRFFTPIFPIILAFLSTIFVYDEVVSEKISVFFVPIVFIILLSPTFFYHVKNNGWKGPLTIAVAEYQDELSPNTAFNHWYLAGLCLYSFLGVIAFVPFGWPFVFMIGIVGTVGWAHAICAIHSNRDRFEGREQER